MKPVLVYGLRLKDYHVSFGQSCLAVCQFSCIFRFNRIQFERKTYCQGHKAWEFVWPTILNILTLFVSWSSF